MSARNRHEGRKIVLANWKASLSPADVEKWLDDFSSMYRPYARLQVVLAVPCLALLTAGVRCRDLENVSLAAQDVSPFPRGGYTGTTPASWLSNVVEYVLVGHRERRRYFHETVQDAANKVNEAVVEGLCPVLCSNRDGIQRQLGAVETPDLERLVLAYTPDAADALEVAAGPDAVSAAMDRFSELGGGRPVLYGGGVHAGNVAKFMVIQNLAGVLVARGCLDPQEFIKLLENADRALAEVV